MKTTVPISYQTLPFWLSLDCVKIAKSNWENVPLKIIASGSACTRVEIERRECLNHASISQVNKSECCFWISMCRSWKITIQIAYKARLLPKVSQSRYQSMEMLFSPASLKTKIRLSKIRFRLSTKDPTQNPVPFRYLRHTKTTVQRLTKVKLSTISRYFNLYHWKL